MLTMIQGVIERSANAHSAIKQWVFPLNVRLYRMIIGVGEINTESQLAQGVFSNDSFVHLFYD